MNYRTSDHGDAPATLTSALEALGRRKWLGLIVFLSVFGGAVSVALSLPNVFRATATVLVERQRVSEAFVTATMTTELEPRIQMIQQQVMSRDRLIQLIGRFDLYAELRKQAPIEALVARMRRDVRGPELKGVTQPTTGRYATIAFTISYSGRDPQTVATVTNALANLYVEDNARIREGQAAQTADFLRTQLQDAKEELDSLERRVSAFKMTHIGELPQQVEANLASIERLNTQLRLNGENQIRAMDRRERLEEKLTDLESAPVPSAPAAPSRSEQLTKLRQELSELRSRFTDAYPDVSRIRGEIATLERRLAEEPPPPPAALPADPMPRMRREIADIGSELRVLKDEEVALRQAIAAYEQRVDNVPRRQEEYQALSRDHSTTKERYDTLVKRYEEAQLAESLEQGKKMEEFRILDPAIVPRVPAGPDRLRLVILGFLAAVALAAGAVIAAEKFNTAFHDIDDLRAFASGAIVLRVPLILTAAATRKRRIRLALGAVLAIAVLGVVLGGAHYIARGNEQIVRLIERGNV